LPTTYIKLIKNKLRIKLYTWIKSIFLGEVDKEFKKPLPHHKKFGNKKAQIERIDKKRIEEQKQMKSGF
tara:strand:- start:343802 stop:344008 length:207 start_codon:yes stop_codon:yes gene_type:complete